MSSQTPAERFASILLCLSHAVAARGCGGWGMASAMIGLITNRIREIKQHFARFADCVRDGRPFARRRTAPRRPRPSSRPRPPSKLPRQAGWLIALMPEAIGFHSQLEYLLRDPEMLALLAAAPVSTVRALRSLCWMLRLPPPPILARPRPAAPPAEPATAPPPIPAAAPRAAMPRRPRPVTPAVPGTSAPRSRPAHPSSRPQPA